MKSVKSMKAGEEDIDLEKKSEEESKEKSYDDMHTVTDTKIIDYKTGTADTDSDSVAECSCLCEAKEAFMRESINFEITDESPHPMIEIWSLVQWLDVSDAIKRLAAMGYDLDFQDELGRTSLHMAVEEQNVPGLRALLELGADPNLPDACSATPLWHAVFWDKESMIKELLFVNVEPECVAKEDAYRIGLPWASNDPSLDHEEIVFSESYVSTLAIAVRKNFCSTVELLLDVGYSTEHENIQELMRKTCVKAKMREVLQGHLSEPQTLFKITRNYIRRSADIKIHRLVADIDMPQRLKDCLLLRDHIDMKIEPDYTHL